MTGSPRDVSITTADRPQGVNGSRPGTIELDRGPAGGLSTAHQHRDATFDTIPGPERHDDLSPPLWDAALAASCVLALFVGFAIPFVAAVAGILAASTPGSISPADILLDLFRFAWNGPIGGAIRIFVTVGLSLFPLVCLVAIAALVELARPGQAEPHSRPPGRNPWK